MTYLLQQVLIFFQMTKVMDIMEDFLKYMGWRYLCLDGGTKTEERASFVQLFNAKESGLHGLRIDESWRSRSQLTDS